MHSSHLCASVDKYELGLIHSSCADCVTGRAYVRSFLYLDQNAMYYWLRFSCNLFEIHTQSSHEYLFCSHEHKRYNIFIYLTYCEAWMQNMERPGMWPAFGERTDIFAHISHSPIRIICFWNGIAPALHWLAASAAMAIWGNTILSVWFDYQYPNKFDCFPNLYDSYTSEMRITICIRTPVNAPLKI